MKEMDEKLSFQMIDISYIIHIRPILDKLRVYLVNYYSALLG